MSSRSLPRAPLHPALPLLDGNAEVRRTAAGDGPKLALTPLSDVPIRLRRNRTCSLPSSSLDFSGCSRSSPRRHRSGSGSSRGARSPCTTIWRSQSQRDAVLPELAKGASKHHCPAAFVQRRSGHDNPPMAATRSLDSSVHQKDRSATAAWYGLRILGNDTWALRVFEYADGAGSGYLLPPEFANVVTNFRRILKELGGKPRSDVEDRERGPFSFDFEYADRDLDGQVEWEDWEAWTEGLECAYGEGRCKAAAVRFLGARQAETRQRHRNIWVLDGFDADASLVLLKACMKPDSPTTYADVVGALERKADPNASLADPHFNEYTPLILLAITPPTVDGTQAARAIHALVAYKADVHRECGLMPFGKLVPLRFAARLQNDQGLEALLQYVDVGDVFQWAAAEDVEGVMLQELCKLGSSDLVQRDAQMSRYDHHATILMKLYASPLIGGGLLQDGAVRLINGEYESGNIRKGCFADPNRPGLEGITALMEVVARGEIDVVEALLRGRARPTQQAHSGTTPLHFAAAHLRPACARLLLDWRAEPHATDHAGFSAWMVVGEATGFEVDDTGRRVPRQQDRPNDNAARRDLLELLRPPLGAAEILLALESNWEALIDDQGASSEVLTRRLRLGESLFFDERCVRYGSYEGRRPQGDYVARVTHVIVSFLELDPLVGQQKELTRYLLQASMGPLPGGTCRHVHRAWPAIDNRGPGRDRLMRAVRRLLAGFAAECNAFRAEIYSSSLDACQALRELPADEICIPLAWQEASPFWATVQRRNILRFDPEWALTIEDGATCCRALMRLRTIDNMAEYSALQTVHRAGMSEMLTRGYETFSRLCNLPFQELIGQFVGRVAAGLGLRVSPPSKLVASKKLKRLNEKASDARAERGLLSWPGRTQKYIRFSSCFYILDTVRTSFVCEGENLAEQVACCMKLVEAFQACTVEADGLCVLRLKSGFAGEAGGKGGYADVKLMCYVDLGESRAFDGTTFPLRIVGEVQIILKAYADVKSRMHLAYEVDRNSFDHAT